VHSERPHRPRPLLQALHEMQNYPDIELYFWGQCYYEIIKFLLKH
jgi:hypothetical protein